MPEIRWVMLLNWTAVDRAIRASCTHKHHRKKMVCDRCAEKQMFPIAANLALLRTILRMPMYPGEDVPERPLRGRKR